MHVSLPRVARSASSTEKLLVGITQDFASHRSDVATV